MGRLLVLLISLFIPTTAYSTPQAALGFVIQWIDPVQNLLSGMAWTPQGVVVCDRDAGALIRIANNQSANVMLDSLNTPVDIEPYNQGWLVLQEEAGSLIAIQPRSNTQRIITDFLNHPTAFTLDNTGHAYIVEFASGRLLKCNLETGETVSLGAIFDKPSDILFSPPNQLIVADQVGLDGREGAIYYLDQSGAVENIERRVVDPTGLARTNQGELFVSTFFIHRHGMMPPHEHTSGGVMRLHARRGPEPVITGIHGPTSLEIEPNGSIIVLEEPTDSIYRYPRNQDRQTLLQGLAPVSHAARAPDGTLIVIQHANQTILAARNPRGELHVWAQPEFGDWQEARLAVDGRGHTYLSDPLLAQIQTFNPSGNVIHTIDGVVPFLLVGMPSGGVYAFTQHGNATSMTKYKNGLFVETNPLNLPYKPTACFVREDGNLLMALANGEVALVSPTGNKIETTIPPQDGRVFSSIAPHRSSENNIWLFETNQRKVYYAGENRTVRQAATLQEDAAILPDPSGALLVTSSGKRFQIRAETTSINDFQNYE